MIFDKDHVYTALDAHMLKPGSLIFVADTMSTLRSRVEKSPEILRLECINDESYERRFRAGSCNYALAYLVKAPDMLKWTDLKPLDVIKKGAEKAVVTYIDTAAKVVCIGCRGLLTDEELEDWEKVEE